jgi:hypothetical protein
MKHQQPKILFVDIETWPIIADVWRLFDQNLSLNQIRADWSILAWAAKWRGKKKIYYKDTGNQKNLRDDSKILPDLWDLMNEADIIVGQNSKRFDVKKINARFLINKIKKCHPPADYRQQDTMQMAKKVFGFTSFKLEYMSKALNLENQKLVKREFAGHDLWSECEKGNKRAWAEMRKYNPIDVLATEELYEKLLAWDNSINFNTYHKMHDNVCGCGSTEFTKYGFRHKNGGKYQRYLCVGCGKAHVGKHNELSDKKRDRMLK